MSIGTPSAMVLLAIHWLATHVGRHWQVIGTIAAITLLAPVLVRRSRTQHTEQEPEEDG